MRFCLIDRIEQVTDDRLVAIKVVSQAEEYLADHFPTFPVLPGVLMLEAAVQASTFLALSRTSFGFSVGVLKSARNIRYGRFVAPGQALRITSHYEKATTSGHGFRIEGLIDVQAHPTTAITGRIEIACFRLADRGGSAELDARLVAAHQARWEELTLALPELAPGAPPSGRDRVPA